MPDTHIKVGGAWKSIDNASVKVGGAWKQVDNIYIKVAGAWKSVWSNTLTLSITDSTPSGSDSGFSPTGFVQSNSTTVSVTAGGTGSYTYSWAQTGTPADSGPYTATNPTGASTAFSDTVAAADVTKDEQWTCTVTDTGNSRQGTITCQVTLTWTDLT